LAKRGVETVGWDSLSYYWKAKTPEQAARDLARVIEHYTRSWHKSEILLIGYSFGADVLPFLIDRLPPTQRDKIKLAAFLGLGTYASFEFHLSDWLGGGTAGRWPTQPEVRKLRGLNRVCVYGEEETDSACPGLASSGVTVIRLPGDHHFGGDYAGIIERLLQTLR
jgi:type IV secretory pathway VirJ component